MSKTIKMPGRIENTETGNVVALAKHIYDDAKGKKQSVINSEVDTAIEGLNSGKQDVLTFDNAPTEGSNNPVKSGGVYSANLTLSQAIDAILLLIPSAATALNQLADKAFVNSSIATDTATFRGTSAPGLSEQQFLAWANTLEHDLNDYVFWNTVDNVGNTQFKRYKWNGTAWAYEYTLNNSSFTADQWATINSTITSALVQKLSALPTASELQIAFNAKQDTLTFDNTPTAGSNNPVKSSGLYTAFATVQGLIDALTGRMTDAEGDIATNTADIATNTADIALLQDLYEALTQSALVVVEPTDTWPVANPDTKTIYRVVDRVNTPPQYYSDYMWNGSAMVLMATYNNAIDDVMTYGNGNVIGNNALIDFITDTIKLNIAIQAFDFSDDHISTNGTISAHGYRKTTDYIKVFGGDKLVYSGLQATSTLCSVAYYDSSKNFIMAGSTEESGELTIPFFVGYVRISTVNNGSPTVQIINEFAAKSKIDDFDNIDKLITGHLSENIGTSNVQKGYIPVNSTTKNDYAWYLTSDYIALSAGETIVFIGAISSSGYVLTVYSSQSQSDFISGIAGHNLDVYSYKNETENTQYVRLTDQTLRINTGKISYIIYGGNGILNRIGALESAINNSDFGVKYIGDNNLKYPNTSPRKACVIFQIDGVDALFTNMASYEAALKSYGIPKSTFAFFPSSFNSHETEIKNISAHGNEVAVHGEVGDRAYNSILQGYFEAFSGLGITPLGFIPQGSNLYPEDLPTAKGYFSWILGNGMDYNAYTSEDFLDSVMSIQNHPCELKRLGLDLQHTDYASGKATVIANAKSAIDKAISEKGLLCFYGHSYNELVEASYTIYADVLDEILQYLKPKIDKGLVVTGNTSDVVEYYWAKRYNE